MTLRGYVFDAYGTLFDVHGVVDAGRAITRDPAALSAAWRQKQLEYTWLRALMGRYADFEVVTEAALRWAIRRLGLRADEADVRRLMDAYLTLACFPDAKPALERLAGRPRAILSNGSPRMLEAAVRSSPLRLVERVGRRGGEGVRLSGGVVQPAGRAGGGAGSPGGRRRPEPRGASALGPRPKTKAARRTRAARGAERASGYRLPSLFRLT